MPIAQAHLLVKPSLLSSVVQKEKAVVIPARAERERIEKAVRDEVERTKDRTPSKREKPQVRMVNGKQHVVTEFTNAAGEKSYLSEPVTGSRTQRERQLAGPDPVKDDNIVRMLSRESSVPLVSSFASAPRKNRVARTTKKPGVRRTSSTCCNPTRTSWALRTLTG